MRKRQLTKKTKRLMSEYYQESADEDLAITKEFEGIESVFEEVEDMNMVNRACAFLEYKGFFILIHWFKSFQIHWHVSSFDKMLTICKFGIFIG